MDLDPKHLLHLQLPVPASCREWVSSVVLLQNPTSQIQILPYLPHFKSGLGLTVQGRLSVSGQILPALGTRSLTTQNGPLEAGPGLMNIAFRFKEGISIQSRMFTPKEFHQEISIDCQSLLPEPEADLAPHSTENALKYLENSLLQLHKKGMLRIEKPCYGPYQKVADWAKALGLSERSLERKCWNSLGLNPKAVLSLSRFRHFLDLMAQPKNGHLLDCALEAGYYDQAHFIHAFKKYAGQSPAAWFQKEALSDFYNT